MFTSFYNNFIAEDRYRMRTHLLDAHEPPPLAAESGQSVY